MYLISTIFFLHVLKLQQTVQEERVARILHGSRTHTITSPTQSPISSHSPPSIHQSARTHTITSPTHSSYQSSPFTNHSARAHTITSHSYTPLQNTSAIHVNHNTGRHTNIPQKRTPLNTLFPPNNSTPLSHHIPQSFTELLALDEENEKANKVTGSLLAPILLKSLR